MKMNLEMRAGMLVLVTSLGLFLSACLHGGEGEGKIPAPDANASRDVSEATPEGTAVTVRIDATAGGLGAPPDDPRNRYTYFDLTSGQVLSELSDEQARRDGRWHVAFKRHRIKLNGGVSGPGAVRGAVADAQEDFYDDAGEPIVSIFTNASAESEQTAFDAVRSGDGLDFMADREVPYILGDGSADGWWSYSGPPEHRVDANPQRWWLVRSAEGNSYAKFHVTGIVQATREITLELFYQGPADDAFSNTPITWTAVLGAGGGRRCFDFDSVTEVDCEGAADTWDLQVEVAARAWNIWTNGGVRGSGRGAAFGPLDASTAANYASGTVSPGGRNIVRLYRQDSTGGIFEEYPWYAYDLLGENKLWPNYRVYAIDTGSAHYKLQILGYYDEAGVSGHYTLRYAALAGSRSFETLQVRLREWAVEAERTRVQPGPVVIQVVNEGPQDVHELVVIRTDLGPGQLPTDADGNVDESSAGIEIVGEIEGLAVGERAQATFELPSGRYVLLCNVWDAGEGESHYRRGMYTALLVE